MKFPTHSLVAFLGALVILFVDNIQPQSNAAQYVILYFVMLISFRQE